jgi:hypothetical protein
MNKTDVTLAAIRSAYFTIFLPFCCGRDSRRCRVMKRQGLTWLSVKMSNTRLTLPR